MQQYVPEQEARQQQQQHWPHQDDASSQGPHGTPASSSATAHAVGDPETNNINRVQQPQSSTPLWHAMEAHAPQTQPAARSASSPMYDGLSQAPQQTQTESVHRQVRLAEQNSPDAMQSRPWDASDARQKAQWKAANGPEVDRCSEQRQGTDTGARPGSEDEQSLYDVDVSEQGDKGMSSSNGRFTKSAGSSMADADLETLHLNVHGQVSEEVQAEPSDPRSRSHRPAFASMAAQTENIVEDLLREVRFARRPSLGTLAPAQTIRI